jgi:hypothetical protein
MCWTDLTSAPKFVAIAMPGRLSGSAADLITLSNDAQSQPKG